MRATGQLGEDMMAGLSRSHARLIRGLLVAAGLLVGFYALNVLAGEPIWELDRLLDLDRENNLPTWFSTILFALAALSAWSCRTASASAQERRVWTLVAAALLFGSCDEAASLHEHLSQELVAAGVRWPGMSESAMYLWPVALGPFVIWALGWLIGAARTCLKGSPAARRLALGIGLFLLGSMGLELFIRPLYADPSLNWLRVIEVIGEESLEMFGLITILSGLFLHYQTLQVRARKPAASRRISRRGHAANRVSALLRA